MNLIIQGINVENSDLRAIAKLSATDQIERITGQAFRLLNASPHQDIGEYCTNACLDYAFVDPAIQLTPENWTLGGYRTNVYTNTDRYTGRQVNTRAGQWVNSSTIFTYNCEKLPQHRKQFIENDVQGHDWSTGNWESIS